jgi:hypothetical protein
VFFQRNLVPTEPAGDGVSTYLALIFGTLLSSQGTDASFVLTRSSRAFLRALPFGLAFPTLPDPFSVPFPVGIHFPVAVGGLLPIRSPCGSLSASPTLSEVFDRPYRPLFLIHRGGLTRESRPRGTGRCSSSPGAYPPLGNCSNLPPHKLRVNGSRGNDDDTNSPTGVDAHQAAVGTMALRSCSSTSPVSPARAARPPRT